jgi:hypothetical protein
MANITVIMCSSANKELNWIEYNLVFEGTLLLYNVVIWFRISPQNPFLWNKELGQRFYDIFQQSRSPRIHLFRQLFNIIQVARGDFVKVTVTQPFVLIFWIAVFQGLFEKIKIK